MKKLNKSTQADLADRYHWYINQGFKKPVFNDPKVIYGDPSVDYIDALIQKGMERWPIEDDEPDDRSAA